MKDQAEERQKRRQHEKGLRTAALQAELRLPVPTVTVEARVAVREMPTAADLMAAAKVPLSAGAQKVYQALHELADQLSRQEVEKLAGQAAQTASTPEGAKFRRAAVRNRQQILPSYVFHCPQALLAAMTGFSVRHQARLLQELVEANLVMTGGQSEPMPMAWMRKDLTAEKLETLKSAGKIPGMYTGTLFRVRLSFEGHAKLYLTRADYGVKHRDLEADTMRGRTPVLWMSELQTLLSGQKPSVTQMTDAVLAFISNLPLNVVRTSTPTDLQNVIYDVYALGERKGAWQALAVNRVAASLSSCFNDPNWKVWWCKQLWTAIRLSTLDTLASRLQRLLHDAREWPGIHNAGAVFAARQKVS